jgi:SpoVK/Ycf46/Vps4 family AAA+-type ATPase
MPSKRKAENFDPNKSDSNDTDFDPSETRAPPKKSRRSAGHKKSSSRPAKRRRYKGSDVSEDDLDDDDDLSVSEQSEEDEDFEMNEKTGRRMRKAATKSVNYEEPSESDQDDLDASDSEEVKVTKNKSPKKRSKPVYDDDDDDEEEEEEKPTPNTPSRSHPKRKVVTLKIGTPAARSTRAGSALQSAAGTRPRRGSTAEPKSAGIAGRRATRATSEALGEEPIALSESGRHVIREGKSPEPLGRRADRGGKGIKQPASTIKEELHESTTQEDHEEDIVMATEVPGTDEREELDDADVGDGDEDEQGQANEVEEGAAQPAVADDDDDDDDDDEDVPITRRRESRPGLVVSDIPAEEEGDATAQQSAGGSRRLRNRSMKNKHQRKPTDASSDFEPVEDSPDELSASDNGAKNDKEDDYESGSQRRGRRGNQAKSKSTSRRRSPDSNPEELDEDELAEELYDLKAGSRKRHPRVLEPGIVYEKSTTRTRKPVDYSIKPMDQIYAMDEDAEDAAPTPTRRGGGGGRTRATQPYERSLYSTFGPFGGGIGPAAVIGGPWGTGAAGGVDSDSSDDENMARPTGVGGSIGMTPTSAMPPGLLPNLGQTNLDPTGALSGTPSALGEVGSRKALADADPLGVDQDVDFSKIGGLDGHIDQLKEMVQMPLLYPELFLKFHVTPPRGVLFHGPPGTGKTLLARALSSTISSGGRKITFYMRKGADALSKWVGEAERQLRLLFEEARKNQPSIIFFDEIDGLAPVRSSKQEQIHASIVSTLLALMDGMDGRGQVIVIGATNRPDNIDPALRRPGRFDREFYFPLPDQAARRSIININTPGWPIDDSFRDKLAEETKGYGGADLRALCTEAAINAMQRTFPQVYHSNDKLIIDTDKVKIIAKDFMLSLKKMIPSSERSTSSGAMPLPKVVEPLLRDELKRIENILDDLIPIKKKTTALQEAMFEQYDDADQGFARETMQQEFERSRVFRPRMLIHGQPGMGQNYIAGAVLNHFEGLHVQSFDLPTIFNDSGRVRDTAETRDRYKLTEPERRTRYRAALC